MLLRILAIVSLVSAVAIWPELTREDGHMNKPRPKNWNEKNFGQWCRNFTAHKHNQCPEASLFHEFDCCGPTGTDCCFHVQGWVIVVGGISAVTTTSIFIFYFLLKWNLIFKEVPTSDL